MRYTREENGVVTEFFGIRTHKGSPVVHSPYNILNVVQ